jgi:hypothetical protein
VNLKEVISVNLDRTDLVSSEMMSSVVKVVEPFSSSSRVFFSLLDTKSFR